MTPADLRGELIALIGKTGLDYHAGDPWTTDRFVDAILELTAPGSAAGTPPDRDAAWEAHLGSLGLIDDPVSRFRDPESAVRGQLYRNGFNAGWAARDAADVMPASPPSTAGHRLSSITGFGERHYIRSWPVCECGVEDAGIYFTQKAALAAHARHAASAVTS